MILCSGIAKPNEHISGLFLRPLIIAGQSTISVLFQSRRKAGITSLHGCGPPGFPQLAWSLKPLRCLQSAFGVRLLYSARQPPPPTAVFLQATNRHSPGSCPAKFCLTLDSSQGFGCVLAEYKRPAPKEWRKTAKRFKAPNRLREARRAAAMEPGQTRTPAANGTEQNKPIFRLKKGRGINPPFFKQR